MWRSAFKKIKHTTEKIANIFKLLLMVKRKEGDFFCLDMECTSKIPCQDHPHVGLNFVAKQISRWEVGLKETRLWRSLQENSDGWAEFRIIRTKWHPNIRLSGRGLWESLTWTFVLVSCYLHVCGLFWCGAWGNIWYKSLVRICTLKKSAVQDSSRNIWTFNMSISYAHILPVETGDVCRRFPAQGRPPYMLALSSTS